MIPWDDKTEPTYDKFCIKLLTEELFGEVINAIGMQIRDS